MKDVLHFLKVALSSSRVGAIARSSRYVVAVIMKLLCGRTLQKIVEYGAGDGVVTLQLLSRLAHDGELLAVDTNPEFLKILRGINDSRLRVVDGTMEDVSKNTEAYGFNNVDLVISSIPYSYISTHDREKMVLLAKKILAPDGIFIVFHQYSTIMVNPIKKYFDDVEITFVPRNFLPCFIISAVNKKSHRT